MTRYCEPVGLSQGDIATLLSPWESAVYAVLPDGRVYGMKKTLFGKLEACYYYFGDKKAGKVLLEGKDRAYLLN